MAKKKVVAKKVVRDIGAELDEVKGDIKRLVELLGAQLGEPFVSNAKLIVERNQGG